MIIDGLRMALLDGCKIRVFRSGGGLRVVRIEDKSGQLKGYGEHPHIEEALYHAGEDYLLGHQEYNSVYGSKYPHYLTGSSEASSIFDALVLMGWNIHFGD